MLLKKSIIILVILLLSSIGASAQDSGKSLLKWFPRGYYELIVGQDLRSIKTSELYEISGKAVASLMRDSPTMEIPGLKGKFNTAVIALIKRTYDAEFRTKKKGKDFIAIAFLEGDLLYAYQFSSLKPLLAKTLKRGRLRKLKEKVNKRPIYGYSESGEPKLYLYATATDVLLVTEKKAALLKMIEAGDGSGQAMLDDPLYIELEREIPESQYWVVSLPREPLRSKLDNIDDQESKEAKEIKGKMEAGKRHLISAIEISDKLIYRERIAFSSEASAKRFYQQQEDNLFEWGGIDLPGSAVESRNKELDGDAINIQINYSMEKLGKYYRDQEARRNKAKKRKLN